MARILKSAYIGGCCLRKGAQNRNSWRTTCITPSSLSEMAEDILYRYSLTNVKYPYQYDVRSMPLYDGTGSAQTPIFDVCPSTQVNAYENIHWEAKLGYERRGCLHNCNRADFSATCYCWHHYKNADNRYALVSNRANPSFYRYSAPDMTGT